MSLILDISTCRNEEFRSRSLICGGEKANIISSLNVSTPVMATVPKCNLNGLKGSVSGFIIFDSTLGFRSQTLGFVGDH